MTEDFELVVIGDRVLIEPDEEKAKTAGGLYLPQGIAEKEKVQAGTVVRTGPGYIIGRADNSEPWMNGSVEPKYIPLQVNEGDFAIFLRREAVEIEYRDKHYLIVPQAGILMVVRRDLPIDPA